MKGSIPEFKRGFTHWSTPFVAPWSISLAMGRWGLWRAFAGFQGAAEGVVGERNVATFILSPTPYPEAARSGQVRRWQEPPKLRQKSNRRPSSQPRPEPLQR